MLIPTRAEIASAVANLPAAAQRPFQFNTGPRTFLTIGAGMVRISRKEPGGADAARERAHWRRIKEIDALVAAEISGLNEPMALHESIEEIRDRIAAENPDLAPVLGGNSTKVTSWSRRSRARMKMTLDTLDYSPLFADGWRVAMVTLTMPGAGWEECVPTPADFKYKVNRLKAEFKREFGFPLEGVWKMEFQRRGAPHLHILMAIPPMKGHINGNRWRAGEDAEFPKWLSHTWARVVGVKNAEERRKHIAAGTGIDYVDEQYRDPRRIATYFSKHGAFAGKEYQNEIPELWRTAVENGAASGQFWGYWGLEKAMASVELNEARTASLWADESGAANLGRLAVDVSRIIGATSTRASRAMVQPMWDAPPSASSTELHLMRAARGTPVGFRA